MYLFVAQCKWIYIFFCYLFIYLFYLFIFLIFFAWYTALGSWIETQAFKHIGASNGTAEICKTLKFMKKKWLRPLFYQADDKISPSHTLSIIVKINGSDQFTQQFFFKCWEYISNDVIIFRVGIASLFITADFLAPFLIG